MKNLYDFLTSLCKDRNMKIEDLQKKLGVSRSTLYRYMKGVNQISPELAQSFINALNMDTQEVLSFTKSISLSVFDQSLVQSRYVIDDFLFETSPKQKTIVDIDMIFYNNDKYLRTLREVFSLIYSFSVRENFRGNAKIVNCLDENIFLHLTSFLEEVFGNELNMEIEHFVGLSENSYLQTAATFINIFPLMKYEKYKLYYREKEMEGVLMNDSILFSLEYTENGNVCKRYFSISFYEHGMPECIAFSDIYMHSFMSKNFENLKHSFNNILQKYDSMDFVDDILLNIQKDFGNYIIKPNPCYDKIPYDAMKSATGRMDEKELIELMSSMYEGVNDSDTMRMALDTALEFVKRRIEYTYNHEQIDVYSRSGMLEFVRTGKLTDHLERLVAFNHNEIRLVIEHIRRRNNDPNDAYKVYITEDELPRKDLIILVLKNYGILIEYVYPHDKKDLWKMLLIQSNRLASIFCDYIENHIPVSLAMSKDKADSFLQELIDGF